MTSVQGLQEIECLAAPDLTQDNAIGPVPKCGAQKITDSDGGQADLLPSRLESHQIRPCHLDLGGVLKEYHAVLIGNECRERGQQRSLSAARSTADEDIPTPDHGIAKTIEKRLRDGTRAHQFLGGKEPGVKLADR